MFLSPAVSSSSKQYQYYIHHSVGQSRSFQCTESLESVRSKDSFKRFVHRIVQCLLLDRSAYCVVWLTELKHSWTLRDSAHDLRLPEVLSLNTPDSPYKSSYFRSFFAECWRWTQFLMILESFLTDLQFGIGLGLTEPDSGSLSCWLSLRTHVHCVLVRSVNESLNMLRSLPVNCEMNGSFQ